jgi:Flp pilus assembly pilin Flp
MIRFWLLLSLPVRDRIEKDDRGAAMVEYALLIALIAAAAITVLGFFGTAISDQFKTVCNKVSANACP